MTVRKTGTFISSVMTGTHFRLSIDGFTPKDFAKYLDGFKKMNGYFVSEYDVFYIVGYARGWDNSEIAECIHIDTGEWFNLPAHTLVDSVRYNCATSDNPDWSRINEWVSNKYCNYTDSNHSLEKIFN